MTARRRLKITGAVFASVMVIGIGPGAAQDTTSPDFAELVAAALQDEDAAARLGEVRSIDGFVVDMEFIIDGSPAEQQDRLSTLHRLVARDGPAPAPSDKLRTDAERITAEPPFSAKGAVGTGWFGQIVHFFSNILRSDGATGLALLVLAALVIAVATPAGLRVAGVRRRRKDDLETVDNVERPSFEETADAAEAEGDFDNAIRLLFLDGVDYLEQTNAVRSAAATSTAMVRRISQETAFLDRFDEVAYGGLPALRGDVTEARSGWSRLKSRRFRP